MTHDKFPTRTIFLCGPEQRIMAERIPANAPFDAHKPLSSLSANG